MDGNENLIGILAKHVRERGDKVCLRYLADGENEAQVLTFAQLWDEATQVSHFIRTCTETFDRVALIDADGYEFVKNFVACLMARRIAVPLFPPSGSRNDARIHSIMKNCDPKLLLCHKDLAEKIKAKAKLKGDADLTALLDRLVSCPTIVEAKADVEESIFGDDCAFIQFSSGSLGEPKGAMVSHSNIVANLEMIAQVLHYSTHTRCVSWLPLFHDMGLIGGVLISLYAGCELILIPHTQFIRNPACWWRAVSHYKATVTGGPNFSYALSVRKLKNYVEDLDLSHLEVAFNGAEPVLHSTLEAFVDTFAPAGFRKEAFLPCYGMAEATLFVAGCPWQRAFHVRDHALAKTETHIRPVSSGGITFQEDLLIVDPKTCEEVREGAEGEIWLRGPNIVRSYWNNSEATIKTFQARLKGDQRGRCFLRTGDLGLKEGAELYITGRLKDLIIVNGANFYAHDIEDQISRLEEIKAGMVAAYPVQTPGSEGVGVVAEISRAAAKGDQEAVLNKLLHCVSDLFQIPVLEVFLIREAQLLRTTSGKIRRGANKDAAHKGELKVVKSWARDGLQCGNDADPVAPAQASSIPRPVAAPAPPTPPRRRADLGKVVKRGQKVNEVKAKVDSGRVESLIREFIAEQAHVNRELIDLSHDLVRYGLDSVAVMDLCATLKEGCNVELAPEDFARLKDIRALVDFVKEKAA